MKAGRALKWVSVVLLLVFIVIGVTLWFLSAHKPSDYRPMTLTREQKDKAYEQMQAKLADFLKKSGRATTQAATQPDADNTFTMAVSQEELNAWVASLPDPAVAELAKMGLSEPAAAIDDGHVTLYVFWKAYDRVVGIDLATTFQPNGQMILKIQAVHLGDLPLPRKTVEQHIEGFRRQIQAELDQARQMDDDEQFAGVPVKEFRKIASVLLTALEGKPITPEINERHAGHIMITGIDLKKGLATVFARSLGPPTEPPAPPGL